LLGYELRKQKSKEKTELQTENQKIYLLSYPGNRQEKPSFSPRHHPKPSTKTRDGTIQLREE